MLKLELDRQPRWLALPHGIRVLVRPLTTAISEAAFSDAINRVRPVKLEAEDAAAAGAPLPPEEPNGANAAWLAGLQWQYLCEAYARYAILEWQGLGDENGEPLPLSPAAFTAFAAHPDLGREFYRLLRGDLDRLDAEGNGSGTSAAGDTAAGTKPAAAAPDALSGPAPEPANDQDAAPAPAS